ncbi:hypothetical protein MHW47_02165 [Streptomyces sp. OfavH-34-F]|uniref:hypothetical protein n=1 Tax=Streptomyces sp. OfavH-34-F TaxID=2917760 RepID=UPI001EF3D2D4|nr:hypothetical protein [Streptomyces sp. OfavH-34-F]MCG7523260.1 hypothetical protein [Streptomyces sp. OfavH-34-F]
MALRFTIRVLRRLRGWPTWRRARKVLLSAQALRSSATTTPRHHLTGDSARAWEPDDAMRRAERALGAASDSDARPELVDTASTFVASGMDRKHTAHGDRPYLLSITCDTYGIEELTLTLSRGDQEQAYGIGCGDREADRFSIPAGESFTAQVDPVENGTGLILWRLDTIARDAVEGCDDDIDGCDS